MDGLVVNQEIMLLRAYSYKGKLFVNGNHFVKYTEKYLLDHKPDEEYYFYQISEEELQNACRKESSSYIDVRLDVVEMPEDYIPFIRTLSNATQTSIKFQQLSEDDKNLILKYESGLNNMDDVTYNHHRDVLLNSITKSKNKLLSAEVERLFEIQDVKRIIKNNENINNTGYQL